MKNIVILFLAMLMIHSHLVFSQTDAKGSSDHPLVSRYEGAWINRYNHKEFEVFNFPTSAKMKDRRAMEEVAEVEGKVTSIEYNLPSGVTATQVFRSYQTQLKKAGFNISFSCEKKDCGRMAQQYVYDHPNASSQLRNAMIGETGSYLVASAKESGKHFHVVLVVGESKNEDHARYRIDIIEEEALDTDKLQVANVTEALEREGKIALYGITFDFNSAELQDSSKPTIELISAYLQENKQATLLIVGHTDNVGDFDVNMSLSEQRAEAVVKSLTTEYNIDAKRVSPIGVGMAAPVATNSHEEGRKLNRRVEVVLR